MYFVLGNGGDNMISQFLFFSLFVISLFPCVSNSSEFIHVGEQYFFELNGETFLMGLEFICDMM